MSLAPETRAVYYERGKLNLVLGDYQQARRDAEQASKLQDPVRLCIGPPGVLPPIDRLLAPG